MLNGKNSALTPAEMDMMNADFRDGNHLYTSDSRSDRAGVIAEIVNVIGDDVMKERRKVNLRDTETVKEIAQEYVKSCQRSILLPSKAGLSRALGYSRKGLYLFMRDNVGHPTEEFLSILFDAFSEAYDVAAMGGAIQQVYAIFTQKAQYGLVDNPERETDPAKDMLGPVQTAEEIIKKYAEALPDE